MQKTLEYKYPLLHRWPPGNERFNNYNSTNRSDNDPPTEKSAPWCRGNWTFYILSCMDDIALRSFFLSSAGVAVHMILFFILPFFLSGLRCHLPLWPLRAPIWTRPSFITCGQAFSLLFRWRAFFLIRRYVFPFFVVFWFCFVCARILISFP